MGVLTIVVPYSGLPIALRTLLTVAFGAVVLSIGLSLRMHEVRREEGELPATPPVSPTPPAIG